jgi:hypothetical protein
VSEGGEGKLGKTGRKYRINSHYALPPKRPKTRGPTPIGDLRRRRGKGGGNQRDEEK